MKRKLISLVGSLLLMVLFVVPVSAQEPVIGDQFIMGQNFTLAAEQTMNGDLLVVGGSVTTEDASKIDGDVAVAGGSVVIKGDVDGDMAVFGGNVTVEGVINGDIAVFGGNVEVKDKAVVDGDIGLVGGQAVIGEEAVVNGQVAPLFGDREDGRKSDNDDDGFDGFRHEFDYEMPSHMSDPGEFVSSAGNSFFGLLGRIISDIVWTISLLIALALISWLVAAFMPEQMVEVRRTVFLAMPASFGTGLVTFLLGGVSLLLILTICLAFIPFMLWVVLGIVMLFGWIVIGQMLGERLLIASGQTNPTFIFSSIVGVVVLTILTNMPIVSEIPCIGFLLGLVGFIIGGVVAFTGMGAVLLSRFGTRPYPDSGGSSYTGSPSPRSGGLSGNRVRWSDPAPDVSDEDALSSEAELNAKIKAALAEAEAERENDDDDDPQNGDKDKDV